MTLQTTTSKAGPVSGNGTLTLFQTGFRVDQPTDLQVIYTDPFGTDHVLSPSLYNATGFGLASGVSVTYPLTGAPIGATEKITLLRAVAYDQQTSLLNQGGFYPAVIEKALDRIVMQGQQLLEKIGRAVSLQASSAFSALTISDPVAGKFLRGRSDGQGWENADITASGMIGIPVSVTQGGTGQTSLAAFASSAASVMSTALGLGTAALLNAGTALGNVVQLAGAALLPPLDGSNLYNTGGVDHPQLIQNCQINASVAGNALTFAIKTRAGTDPSPTNPVRVAFRSTPITSGGYVVRTITGPLSLTISAGSTLGFNGAETNWLHVGFIDNAGLVEMAVSKDGAVWRENSLISTTVEGGAGNSDFSNSIYAVALRLNVACRLVGMVNIQTGATPGNWQFAPLEVALITSNPASPFKNAAKAWVNFTEVTSSAIRDGYNINSIIDNGIGDSTIIFSTPLQDNNYCVNVGCQPNSGNIVAAGVKVGSTPTASSVNLVTYSIGTTPTAVDAAAVYVSIFGNASI